MIHERLNIPSILIVLRASHHPGLGLSTNENQICRVNNKIDKKCAHATMLKYNSKFATKQKPFHKTNKITTFNENRKSWNSRFKHSDWRYTNSLNTWEFIMTWISIYRIWAKIWVLLLEFKREFYNADFISSKCRFNFLFQ